MKGAYYNEFDRNAAAWLRELMAAGHIAPGEVDDRSIVEVAPDDLRGYSQCHFFAGIGVWSYALRRAGWDDARPVWTASLPCQPFSAAGKGEGHADERHLADVWLRLARECRPAIAIGEQVEPAIGYGWLDALFIQLEQSGYACGAAVFPACSVGAPHIRPRLYWVAESIGRKEHAAAAGRLHAESSECRPTDGMAHSAGDGWREGWPESAREQRRFDAAECRPTDWLVHADGAGSGLEREHRLCADGDPCSGTDANQCETVNAWSDAVWWPCRDGKSRPVGRGIGPLVVADAARAGSQAERYEGAFQGGDECAIDADRQRSVEPGSISLADGTAADVGRVRNSSAPADPLNTSESRVTRLKGYGNAIVAPAAQAFIEVAMECVS